MAPFLVRGKKTEGERCGGGDAFGCLMERAEEIEGGPEVFRVINEFTTKADYLRPVL